MRDQAIQAMIAIYIKDQRAIAILRANVRARFKPLNKRRARLIGLTRLIKLADAEPLVDKP